MRGKSWWAGVAVLAAGLIFVTGGGAATTTTVTLTVNSTADSTTACTIANHKSTGTCTLRGAILAADNYGHDNTMFVIKLAAKTYHLTLGTLPVEGDSSPTSANIVQIVGATAGKKKVPASVIDGSGNTKPSSVIEINSPTQMSNVVITGGSGNGGYKCDGSNTGCGGGIFLTSALDLQNSVVRNNTACSVWVGNACTSGQYEYGGGIYMPDDSTQQLLTLYKTTVTHNVAYDGGGIANDDTLHSTVLIMWSHIDKNIACDTFSNGVCIGNGNGGGLYNDGEQITFEHSTVNGNVAGSPAVGSGDGGGIYQNNDNMQLNHTTVSGNVAGNWGGGIDAEDDNVDIVNSTISGNIAGASGGGLHMYYLASFKNSTFSSNSAGGTFACTINGGTTSCNSTIKATTGTCNALYPGATYCVDKDGRGGGIMSDREYPELITTTVTKNLAVTIAGDVANCEGGRGGGIYSEWTLTAIAGTKITDNTADCGGGLFNYEGKDSPHTFALSNSMISGNTALADGGGIWTSGSGTGALYGMTITKNHANGQTGGVWDDQLGSVLVGVGNTITKNTSTGACKNITFPCN